VSELTTLPLACARRDTKYDVTDETQLRAIVESLSAALEADPSATVQVGGHTSEDEASNAHLGLLRARRLRFWLAHRGLPEARMKVANFGASQPVTASAERQDRNRRVTVRVLPAPRE
jgi:outer membrane protein OmpA-like peptidoglycan-associated protein